MPLLHFVITTVAVISPLRHAVVASLCAVVAHCLSPRLLTVKDAGICGPVHSVLWPVVHAAAMAGRCALESRVGSAGNVVGALFGVAARVRRHAGVPRRPPPEVDSAAAAHHVLPAVLLSVPVVSAVVGATVCTVPPELHGRQ